MLMKNFNRSTKLFLYYIIFSCLLYLYAQNVSKTPIRKEKKIIWCTRKTEHKFVCLFVCFLSLTTFSRLTLFSTSLSQHWDPCSPFPQTLHPPLTNNNLLPRELLLEHSGGSLQQSLLIGADSEIWWCGRQGWDSIGCGESQWEGTVTMNVLRTHVYNDGGERKNGAAQDLQTLWVSQWSHQNIEMCYNFSEHTWEEFCLSVCLPLVLALCLLE